MNKRGATDLLWTIILVLLVVTAASFLIYWINSNTTGRLIKSEVDAKQTALLIDSANPNTLITVSKPVSLSGNQIRAQNEQIIADYSTFNPNKISITANGEQREISIQK
jgi:hypothetical protein